MNSDGTPNGTEQDRWVEFATENLLQARQYGKPVIPYIWPRFHGGGGSTDPESTSYRYWKYREIRPEFWRVILETSKEFADGAVIYDAANALTADEASLRRWDDNAAWWLETKSFISEIRPPCDFDLNSFCDVTDLDALVAEIAAGTNDSRFDLTEDDLVNLADRDQWLADAGGRDLPSGNAYQLADGNLDGVVDGSDFNIWNANKFTIIAAWSAGDFNADGVVDGSDFNIWNANKFQGSGNARSMAGLFPTPVFVNAENDSEAKREGIAERVDAVFEDWRFGEFDRDFDLTI